MQVLKTLNPEQASEKEYLAYPTREAARAVVFDTDANVALLFVSRENYYKLPGGGIEKDEDFVTALSRECEEEIGCDVEVIAELGTIVEHRKFCRLNQISYCYVAKVRSEKSTPEMTPEEIAEGYQLLWLPYIDALQLLSKNEAHNLEGKKYIVPRDLLILKAAKNIFESEKIFFT